MSNQDDINAPIRILLLGSDTEIGSALLAFSKDQNEFEWLCPSESVLLGSQVETELETLQYDVVIDALSLRHALQDDYSKVQHVLSLLSEKKTAPIMMISSVRVFSGEKSASYLETDEPDGTDSYAQVLIASEEIVLRHEENIVLRTGWLFSGHSDDFVCRTLGLIQDGVNLAYKDNLVGCPTPVSDLARVALSVIKQRHYGAKNTGIYHYCCAEEISWIGLVEAILATSGQMDPKVNVEVESIEDSLMVMDGEVTQIKRQSLSCRRVFNHYGVKQRPWRSSLRNLVKELYKTN